MVNMILSAIILKHNKDTARQTSTKRNRDGEADEQSDCQLPAKSHRISGQLIVQDDSEDDIPVKTILSRRSINYGQDTNVLKPQSEYHNDSLQAVSTREGNLRQGVIEIPDSHPHSPLFCTPSETPSVMEFAIPPSNQNRGCGGLGERDSGGHRSRGGLNNMYGGFHGCISSTVTPANVDGPPANAPKGPKAMREGGLPKNGVYGKGGYSGGGRNLHHTTTPQADQVPPTVANTMGYVQIEERLHALEAEKRQDRERVVELEAQLDLIKKQQDVKIRELKKQMNHAINQTLMQ
jgi:hypothetical protein